MRLTPRDRRALREHLRETRVAAGWVESLDEAGTIEWLLAEAEAAAGDSALGSQARVVARVALDVFREHRRGPAPGGMRAGDLVEAAEALAVAVRLCADDAVAVDPALEIVRRYAERGLPVPASVSDRLLRRDDLWARPETAPEDVLPRVLRDLLEAAADHLGDALRRDAHDLLDRWDSWREWTSDQMARVGEILFGLRPARRAG